MIETAVIGVGSPFGDDDVAFRVIEQLKQDVGISDNLAIHYHDRPGIALLTFMQDFSFVHLIDAVLSQNTPGNIYHFDNIEHFQKIPKPLSSHGLGLAEVLALGEAMNSLPPTYYIHGIGICESPTPTQRQHISAACQTLTTELMAIFSTKD